MKAWSILLATVAGGLALAAADAQPAPLRPATDLPPGLIRQGGVVMMQPIADSGHAPSGGSVFGGERKVGLVRSLSASDHVIFNRAVETAERGDWTAARSLAAEGTDPIARRLLEWGYLLDRNSGASFAQIAQFLREHPDWPEHNVLLARAEKAIGPAMDANAVIAWFGDRAPQTGIGKVRLAEALNETGAPSRARALIREAWIENSFEPEDELYVISRHGDVLTPDIDRQRLERLFAENDLIAARHEMARLSSDVQRLAEARLSLRTNPELGEREARALPPPLGDDPGLLFDQARAFRQRNDLADIPSLLARARTGDTAKLDPTRWWAEVNLDVRASLQAGFYRNAYALAADSALPRDTGEYGEAEFLAGWIALRRLKEPRMARTHFENLERVAARPISQSRARYWEARACEAEGDTGAALEHYHAAAEYPATFYGQLALARLAAAPALPLQETQVDASGARASYDREELTQAIRILGDLGLENALREFALQDAEAHPDAAHVKVLAEDLSRMGYREVALRVAKTASYNGIHFPEYSHPLIAIPRYTGSGTPPENALVLAIIRQETEFDPDSVSSAGARGIMQVMPDSARRSAELAGLNYRPAALTGDADYNMQLGMTELSGYLSAWGGSYILAAAAYNAGRGNARKWMAAYGDPRDALIDPVDWIEQIPFNETRNYVQRVLENLEVYRDRLADRAEPLQILNDLYRPDPPPISPLHDALPEPNASGRASDAGISPKARAPVQEEMSSPGAATAVTPKFKPPL